MRCFYQMVGKHQQPCKPLTHGHYYGLIYVPIYISIKNLITKEFEVDWIKAHGEINCTLHKCVYCIALLAWLDMSKLVWLPYVILQNQFLVCSFILRDGLCVDGLHKLRTLMIGHFGTFVHCSSCRHSKGTNADVTQDYFRNM